MRKPVVLYGLALAIALIPLLVDAPQALGQSITLRIAHTTAPTGDFERRLRGRVGLAGPT